MSCANRYFFAHDKAHVRPWDIAAPWENSFQSLCDYHGQALRAFDTLVGPRGFEVFMVWSLDDIPKTGRNVVVMLIGDERYQRPSYADHVLAVFKTGAVEPFQPYGGRDVGLPVRLADGLRTVRDFGVRWKRGVPRLGGNVFPIPLGYHQQVDVRMRGIAERTSDVFFAGGRGARVLWRDPRSWSVRPRTLSRQAMFAAVDGLCERRPEFHYDVAMPMGNAPLYGPEAYSEHLMNAKIALCPRGNFPETFRHFEAGRAGCVIVTEPLPPVWYFDGLPAVVIGDWREAPHVIEELLSAPDRLAALHLETQAWWRETASPLSLARYMKHQLDVLSGADWERSGHWERSGR